MCIYHSAEMVWVIYRMDKPAMTPGEIVAEFRKGCSNARPGTDECLECTAYAIGLMRRHGMTSSEAYSRLIGMRPDATLVAED